MIKMAQLVYCLFFHTFWTQKSSQSFILSLGYTASNDFANFIGIKYLSFPLAFIELLLHKGLICVKFLYS